MIRLESLSTLRRCRHCIKYPLLLHLLKHVFEGAGSDDIVPHPAKLGGEGVTLSKQRHVTLLNPPSRLLHCLLAPFISHRPVQHNMSHDQDDQASSNVLESLPIEIWLMITPYLNAKDLLSFCASSRQIQQNSEIRESASYWSRLTISTFRVRNRLVVEHDGRRWMGLYRRMRTQTKPFGWGNNDRGCMGLQQNGGAITGAMRRGRRVHPGHGHMQLHWPKELDLGVEGGVIADLQCGGWSTVTLSVKGVLSLTGEFLAWAPSLSVNDPSQACWMARRSPKVRHSSRF